MTATAAPEVVAWLQENAIDGEPLLILACRQRRADVLKHLLAQNPNLIQLDQYGNNALWAACYAESADCIGLLLAAGIDIDFQNDSGATALIYAASSGKYAVAEQLLQAGANPLLRTQDDFSALDLAATRECLGLLRRATSQVLSKR